MTSIALNFDQSKPVGSARNAFNHLSGDSNELVKLAKWLGTMVENVTKQVIRDGNEKAAKSLAAIQEKLPFTRFALDFQNTNQAYRINGASQAIFRGDEQEAVKRAADELRIAIVDFEKDKPGSYQYLTSLINEIKKRLSTFIRQGDEYSNNDVHSLIAYKIGADYDSHSSIIKSTIEKYGPEKGIELFKILIESFPCWEGKAKKKVKTGDTELSNIRWLYLLAKLASETGLSSAHFRDLLTVVKRAGFNLKGSLDFDQERSIQKIAKLYETNAITSDHIKVIANVFPGFKDHQAQYFFGDRSVWRD